MAEPRRYEYRTRIKRSAGKMENTVNKFVCGWYARGRFNRRRMGGAGMMFAFSETFYDFRRPLSTMLSCIHSRDTFPCTPALYI
jgi:hypothetical protein